jgi:diacylglycerol kinase family enzyme
MLSRGVPIRAKMSHRREATEPDAMRIAAIINKGASTIKMADAEQLSAHICRSFEACGHEPTVLVLEDGGDVISAIETAAKDHRTDVILAGGGDGTISAAAGIVQGTDKALAVLPGGNMNLFARSLAIPLDLSGAVTALAQGQSAVADIAFANDRPFIHEFSLGLHPEMIEERDRQKFGSRIGKLVGSARSLWSVLRRPPRIRVWLDDGSGAERKLVTAALAVSNNPFGEGHLPYADGVDGGVLGVYIAHTVRPGDLAAMAARLSTGGWRDLPKMEVFTATSLKLTRKRRVKAAIDGELVKMRGPVDIRIAPGALKVIVPRDEDAVRGQ